MKKIIAILLAIVILIPGTQFSYATAETLEVIQEEETIKDADLEFLESVLDMIHERYPFETDEDKLIKGGVKGILQTLDPHSDYYTKEEAETLMSMTTGEIVGIGVVIELKDGLINVREVFKDSPAEKAGIKQDDKIVSINYESLLGLTLPEVSSRIKGEKGTSVKITVFRGEEYVDFEMVRKEIKINPVQFEILEGNIGYMSIDEFSYDLSKYTELAFKDMDQKGSKGLILDLRDNPGGLLNEAIKLSRKLVPKGDIVHIRYKDRMETIESKLERPKYKIMVLVNENSASASEIVAGAIKDRGVGKLVGSRTYGKATVQSIMPITDGSIVKMTIGEYLTPSKEPINGIGIEVDYEVKNTGTEDLQLKKAVELLK